MVDQKSIYMDVVSKIKEHPDDKDLQTKFFEIHTAYHEASHALVAAWFKAERIAEISIISQPEKYKSEGHVRFYRVQESECLKKIEERVMIDLAGWVAQDLLLLEHNGNCTGSYDCR